MPLFQTFKIVTLAFRMAPLRLFLTILGVVIGVAAVIMVMSIGASAQKLVVSQVEKVGSNLIAILPGASEETGPPAQALGIVTTSFTYEDLEALRNKQEVPNVEAIAGYVSGSATLESLYESFDVSFQGVSPEMAVVENMEISEGRFFESEEEQAGGRLIVLGALRAEEFFPNGDAIGSEVTLKKKRFQVIGVLKAKGATAFANPDELVYVPLGTAQRELLGIKYLNFARAKVNSTEGIEKAIQDMDQVLRRRHNIDDDEEADYSLRNTASAISVLTNVTDILKYFLLLIASLSLLVGGIGIMNSLLIAVNQRIREIGLRKAVGARQQDIVKQFLLEASIITGIGGLLGIILGVAVAFLVSVIAVQFGYEWQFIVPFSSVGVGFFVSVSIGLIFGVYPSLRAAKVSPLEALRYE